jgi:hypothetical protein
MRHDQSEAETCYSQNTKTNDTKRILLEYNNT